MDRDERRARGSKEQDEVASLAARLKCIWRSLRKDRLRNTRRLFASLSKPLARFDPAYGSSTDLRGYRSASGPLQANPSAAFNPQILV